MAPETYDAKEENETRSESSSMLYLLTPDSSKGAFHRNLAQTVHTWHHGRGRYIVIHASQEGTKARIETFLVGPDGQRGERQQWMVEGGKYKASFLLPDASGKEGSESSKGLLISEVSF